MVIKRVVKNIKIISLICFSILFLTSCKGSNPDYILEGARDNGFIPAYRAYFAIKNDSIKKIPKFIYDIYHHNDDYGYIPETYYSFDINVTGNNPSEWEYEESEYNDSEYDIDKIKEYLSTMELDYSNKSEDDKIYLLLTEFDNDYTIVEITLLDNNNQVINSKYAIFHNGDKLSSKEELDLSDIRSIHKYHE